MQGLCTTRGGPSVREIDCSRTEHKKKDEDGRKLSTRPRIRSYEYTLSPRGIRCLGKDTEGYVLDEWKVGEDERTTSSGLGALVWKERGSTPAPPFLLLRTGPPKKKI